MEFGGESQASIWSRLSDELTKAPSDSQALLNALTRALTSARAGTWVALLMDPEPTTASIVVADDANRAMANYIEKIIAAARGPGGTPTFGLARRVIESGDQMLIPSTTLADLIAQVSPAARDYYAANPPPAAIGDISVLIVPMRVGGATIGALSLFDWHPDSTLDSTDQAWLQAIADRAALALDHARMYSAQRRQVDRLGVIAGIVSTAGLSQDLRLTMRVVVDEVTGRLQVDAADVLQLDTAGNGLSVAARAGFRTKSPDDHLLALDGPAAGLIAPLRVERMADSEVLKSNPRRLLFLREGFETCVRVPLTARGGLIGMLEIFNRSPIEWDQESLSFFETLGQVAAVAIDYAMLVEPRRPVAGRHSARASMPDLSQLELRILALLVEGLTNREISLRVHRSESAVKGHVRHILDVTDTLNRTDLARKAALEGWIERARGS